MNQFWNAFWPDVAATAIGVVLGLPLALWIDRVGRAAAERVAIAEANTRLRDGLVTIVTALTHNRDALQELAGKLRGDRLPPDAPLDTVAWNAARNEIVPFLRRPELQRRVAFYFSRLHALSRLVGVYGDIQVADRQPQVAREDLRSHIVYEIRRLSEEGDKLTSDLREIVRTR